MLESCLSPVGLLLLDSGRRSSSKVEIMMFELFLGSLAHCTSEHILVLLLGEIDIIVSVGMGEFSSVVSVVLPGRVGAEVGAGTIGPILDLKVRHGSAFVVVGYAHGSLVSLVIDGLGSEVPLLLFSKSLEHVVWAHLHNRYFLVVASIVTMGGRAVLELSDFPITTSGDERWLKGHELRLLHVRVAHRTVFVTQGLGFTIGVPVIVSLVVPVVLLEGVVQVLSLIHI